MLERHIHWNIYWMCDGCGEIDFVGGPYSTLAEVRRELRVPGHRNYGKLDYCPSCVRNGTARRRASLFGGGANER